MIKLAYRPGTFGVILEGVNFLHSNFGEFSKDVEYAWIPNNLGGTPITAATLRDIADALDKLNANKPAEINLNQPKATP